MPRLVRAALLAVCAGLAAPALGDERIDDPVKVAVEGVATESQVGRAVRAALVRRGWVPATDRARYVEAELTKGDEYYVKIGITYDAAGATIRYLASQGLDFDPYSRHIHSSYNKWMRMLAKEVRINLTLFAGESPRERENPGDIVIEPRVVPVDPPAGAAAPAIAPTPPAGTAPAPPTQPAPAAPVPTTLRAGAELRVQPRLAAKVAAINAAAAGVTPKGPVRNVDGTWWYVATPSGTGWARQADLQ